MFKDNQDFYPTPKELTYKLLDKLYNNTDYKRAFYECKYILEPEAGNGSMIESFYDYYVDKQVSVYEEINSKIDDIRRKRYCNEEKLLQEAKDKFNFDCIEIDERLNNMLRGKAFNVIWNDYLTFSPPRFYDLIIQNVPFSTGVHHLLKSLEIQERIGGKILAIINAETIKNPYSKERKQLVNKLQEYNADIEYVQNAFLEAERETNVEVALIYINVPMKNQESLFEKEFKKTHIEINGVDDFNALIPRMNKLQQLCFEFKTCRDSIVKLYEERLRIKKLFKGLNIEQGIGITDDDKYSRSSPLTANEFIEKLNLKYWEKFIKETDFKSKLPTSLRDTFSYNMERQKDIEFNIENVQYFYENLMMAIPQNYEESVAKVFNTLTSKHSYTDTLYNKTIHYFDGWRSNCCYMIKPNGKTITPFYGYCNYNLPDVLIDLNVIFCNISGEKDNINTQEIVDRIKNYEKNIETKFFIFDSFKKGTIHTRFKNEEYVKIFNLIANVGNNSLPPNFTKKKYQDMTEDEKKMVKEFGFEPIEFNNMVDSNTSYIKLLN